MSTPIATPEWQLLTLDAALARITDEIEEALKADDHGDVEVLLRVDQTLQEQRKDEIDKLVLSFLSIESLIILNQQQAEIFDEQAKRLRAVSDRLRQHVQHYIDENLPEDNRKLAGNKCSIRTQSNSQASLVLHNPEAIPKELHSYEITLRVPAAGNAEAVLAAIEQAAAGFGAVADVRRDREGAIKLVPDEKRIKEHLESNSEEWGRYERGRHLRTTPALSEARKALVKA